jgi:hypothetical protein
MTRRKPEAANELTLVGATGYDNLAVLSSLTDPLEGIEGQPALLSSRAVT